MTVSSHPRRDRIIAALYFTLVAVTAIVVVWSMRQGWAVFKLRRGVGDTWFYAADGRAWFRMDEQRRDVTLDAIAPDLQHAVIAVEDHRFYRHFGIDPVGLGRAVWRDARGADRMEGGSTLTQQLARTLFLSNKRTLGRKAQEAVLALLLEQELTKNQILELYLNRIYLSGGVYGVETMSRNLFGKPASAVTLPEAALLAGLIRAPSALSPWSNLDGAIERSHVVLRRMRDENFISADQERAAARVRVRIRPYPGATEARWGYAKEFLRQQFRDRFGGDHPPDWEVRTTFDLDLQDAAERAVADGLKRFGDANLQAALVAIDPATGNILAMVGGRDFRESQFNRAWRSRRQPGSSFKPILYAAALARGYSPVSELTGLSTIAPQGPNEWAPRNASGEDPDVLTLRAALIESNNRAATLLQQRIGSKPVLQLAADVGLNDLPDVPSLSLGTGLVTPLQLTAAFAMFPNGGSAVQPRALDRGHRPGRRRRLRQPRAGGSRDSGTGRLSDGVDARGRHRSRHRQPGPHRLRPAFSGRRQDRDDRRFQGRLVRRVHVVDRHRRLGRARPAGADRPQRLRGPLRPADLERLHARRVAQAAGPRFRAAFRHAGRTAVQGVVPAAGRGVSDLHGVLQGR